MPDEWEKWTFGELDGTLSKIHDIADNKRTAFQARLKNFHRLNFPTEFKSEKGKTSYYTAEQVVQMALAVELTQLGLPPERTAMVLSLNWFPAMMAMRLAGRTLEEHPQGFTDQNWHTENDPMSIFLYFDPAALSPLMLGMDPTKVPDIDITTRSFFYGDTKVIQKNIVGWTTSTKSRISLVNLTTMIDNLVKEKHHQPTRQNFFKQIGDWSDKYEAERGDWCAEEHVFDFLDAFFFGPPTEPPSKLIQELSEQLHIRTEIVQKVWDEHHRREKQRIDQ